MKTIQLKRQGVSNTLKGSFYPEDNKNKYYSIEISRNGKRDYFNIKVNDYFQSSGRSLMNETALTLEKSKEKVINYFLENFYMKIEFSDFVEGYCFPYGLDRCGVESWADTQSNDYYLTHAYYCPYSDTIRHAIFNYCLVKFNGDVDNYELEYDKATHHWDKTIKETLNSNWLSSCDREKGDLYCKGRLAWLLSEKFKQIRPEKPVKMRTIIQGNTQNKYEHTLVETQF